jgi:cell division inhibitor SepF
MGRSRDGRSGRTFGGRATQGRKARTTRWRGLVVGSGSVTDLLGIATLHVLTRIADADGGIEADSAAWDESNYQFRRNETRIQQRHSPQSDPPDYLRAPNTAVINAAGYSDAVDITRCLRMRMNVVLDLRIASESDAKRLLDFSAGAASALGAYLERIDHRVFLLTIIHHGPADPASSAERIGGPTAPTRVAKSPGVRTETPSDPQEREHER